MLGDDDLMRRVDRELAVVALNKGSLCHRLMVVSGRGALTALAIVTTVEDPTRVRRSSSVGVYFDLL